MPASKTYTKAQWDEFARSLDALPEKPPSEQRVTVRDAMPTFRAHINAARARGYSLEQPIDQAKEVGTDITPSAFRYTLQDTTNAHPHPPDTWLPTIARQSEPACHSFNPAEARPAVRYAVASNGGTRQQQTLIDDRSRRVQFPDQTGYGKPLNARVMETALDNQTCFDKMKVDSAEQGHQRART